MKGVIDEGKEMSPMFPRLHVKDAKKGAPKAPPRNKMALYEQFTIPSQSFSSGSGSFFSLPLRNCTVPSISSHVSSNQSIQFCTTNAPSILAEQIQEYNSRKIDFTKLMQGGFLNSKTSLKTLHGENGFITSGPGHGKNSCCSLVQNDKDEDKLDNRNSSCSVKSLNSFRKKVNSLDVIEPKITQYDKNQLEAIRVGLKPEEGFAHKKLDGLVDMNDDASLISSAKDKNLKPMKKEIISLNDEIRSTSRDSFRELLGSTAQTHKDHANSGDSTNLGDSCFEKPPPAVNVHKYPDELEIGQRCFLSRRNMNKDEETYRHYDALNKPISECILGMDISPDNVLRVIGEKQFLKARRTIVNQQKIFILQVFELHRLIEVQRTIARSPQLLHEDNFLFNKTPLKPSAFKKLQSDYLADRSPLLKHDSKLEKPATAAEQAKGDTISEIPLPCVSNMSKISHVNNQIPNYEHHHLRNHSALTGLDIDTTKLHHSSSCVYPPPGNQWLVPVMSPSEGLVYKPIMGSCPPNAGFMPPIYGTMSFNPITKDVPDSSLGSNSQHRMGILSGSSLPHHFLPPLMHPSMSHSAVEQMGQSINCSENQHHWLTGESDSAILYRNSSSNISSSQTSQVMSRNVANHHHNQSSLKDKELQRSTASSPSSKRMKCDVLPLFPVAPTFWTSLTKDDDNKKNTQQNDDHDVDYHNNQQQNQNHPRVIKAMPHNPKSATESAARIFRSIQEERKNIYN